METLNKINQNAINDKNHFLINKPKTKCIWKSENSAFYIDKSGEVDSSFLEDKLNKAEVVPIDSNNNIVGDISILLKDVAFDSGMSKPVTAKPSKLRRRSLLHKPWYNFDCESTRRIMLGYRNKHRKLKKKKISLNR